MKKIRINFEKFSDGILIPQFPWPNTEICNVNITRLGKEIRSCSGSVF